jgi:uncharacterized protein (TIGR03437 family)
VRLALIGALTASCLLAEGSTLVRTNSFFGNDPRRWTTRLSPAPARSPARAFGQSPSQNAAAYTVNIAGTRDLQPVKIAADAQGGVYVAGNVLSPHPGFSGALNSDVFLMRLDPAGRIIYTTYFGGEDGDTVTDMTLDSAGRVFLTGSTTSRDFPVVNAVQRDRHGSIDAFVCQLSPNGGFVYSTYLGGQRDDSANAIAADSTGNAYVTGYTRSPDFPVTEGAFQTRPVQPNPFQSPANAFVTKISPEGTRLVYSTLLGGTQVTCSGGSSCIPAAPFDAGRAIAIDEEGQAIVAGSTNSLDFPVTAGALRSECRCYWRTSPGTGFVTKLNASGSALVFSTYFGGEPGLDFSRGVTITSVARQRSGDIYLTGSTILNNFPTTAGAYRTNPGTSADPFTSPTGFITRLSSTGSLIYSTLLSGKPQETGNALQVDAQGNAYVAGETRAAEFPVSAGGFHRGADFFVKLNPAGSGLLFSSLLPGGFGGRGVSLASSGDVYLLGTSSYISRFPGSPPRLPAILGISHAARDRVGGRIAPGELISIFGTDIGPEQPAGLQVDEDGRVSKALAGVEVLIDGVAAPLLYAQRDQINAVAPFGLRWSSYALVQVLRNRIEAGQVGMRSVAADPDVFRIPGSSRAAALNENGTINSPQNRARAGSIVVIFATGLGSIEGANQDGEISRAPLPNAGLPVSILRPVQNPEPLEIVYAGQAPEMVNGVVQINFRLPAGPLGDPLFLFMRYADADTPGFFVHTTP